MNTPSLMPSSLPRSLAFAGRTRSFFAVGIASLPRPVVNAWPDEAMKPIWPTGRQLPVIRRPTEHMFPGPSARCMRENFHLSGAPVFQLMPECAGVVWRYFCDTGYDAVSPLACRESALARGVAASKGSRGSDEVAIENGNLARALPYLASVPASVSICRHFIASLRRERRMWRPHNPSTHSSICSRLGQ